MKRPILYCAISFSIGISIAYFFRVPVICFVAAGLALIALAVLSFKKDILSHIFLYLALVLSGAAYCQNYNILPANHIANFTSDEGRRVSIRGVVADDPVRKKAFYGKERVSFVIKSNLLTEGLRSYGVTGLVKVDVYTDEKECAINFADEITAQGVLSRPKGLKNPLPFDYSKYLKVKNIYALFTVNNIDSIRVVRTSVSDPVRLRAYFLRNRIEGAITRYVDGRYGSFLKAILIGDRSGLETSVTDDFIKTGTVHVIAISGLHIALIAGIFIFILKAFGVRKKFNLIFTSVFVVFYCFVAGANPPVVRATLMFVIISLGYIINRESDMLNSLAIAAFIILLGNPNELFDPSFQLSFLSVAGIILFSPRIEGLFGPKRNYFTKGIAASMAAIIAVSPVVGKYFNIFSPAAIIANLVIVPALFIITAASFVFILLDLLGLKFMLIYAGGILSFLIKGTFYINHLLSGIPLSCIRVPSASLYFIVLYYAFVLSFFFLKQKKLLLILLLFLVNLSVWRELPYLSRNSEELKITFLDVGKGDSILLEFPDKKNMLIDAGAGGIEGLTDMGRSIVAPILWNKGIKRLDAVITTHFHSDHMGGLLYILKNFNAGCVMDGGFTPDSGKRLYGSYRKLVLQKNLRRLKIAAGDEILGFGDVKLFVINPPDECAGWDANNRSVVIKLEYKNFSALLCGDVSGRAIEGMLKHPEFLKSKVLKIPHHGGSAGDKGLVEIFFEEVSPEVSIISSGADLRPKTASRDNIYAGSAIYDTKANGAIEVITDGNTFLIKPFCQKN